MIRSGLLLLLTVLLCCRVPAQTSDDRRCSNNPARAWWKAGYYYISLGIDTSTGYLHGEVLIRGSVTGIPVDSLQIDLQEPLKITSVQYRGALQQSNGYRAVSRMERYGDAYYIFDRDFQALKTGDSFTLVIGYEGYPVKATRAPWDGGLVMEKDNKGKAWIGMACQGQGASIWLPCKDFQGEEPDSIALKLIVPAGMQAIGNGRLTDIQKSEAADSWLWKVRNPINLYDISFYLGDYVHWSDTLQGAKGPLSLDYYVLRPNLARAKAQFKVVKPMLRCFEEKLGPYPFYEDGYKLVESPYLGMEHQSAVAYGNGYQMGYKGKDRSRTGAGLDFDYIIVHESGHEWFGNNITAYDKADTWIQEGFTTYTETIFEECQKGRDRAFLYQRGKKYIVRNDRPVQGQYGACDEGSGDHYEKAALMIHMIRQIVADDARFFGMLKAMNQRFYHQTVNGSEVESFMSSYAGKDLSRIFNQYLRQTEPPVLALKWRKGVLQYQWKDCVPGFDMPIRIQLDGQLVWLYPTETMMEMPLKKGKIVPDPDFLVNYEY
ncbi:M1 family metallopeptidase [Taibaiella koreensis]|uniref:M1 family metallopeptidase n=1 Tax=Taibaiella koreensis TaxID=1268548 RepID=UPI000E59DAD7|nr:M1 family metallopeptidase [Taibaiella koreensis]